MSADAYRESADGTAAADQILNLQLVVNTVLQC
jgi:hypothetical protein